MFDPKTYVIQFSGLKPGEHPFNFELGKSFFQNFEVEDIWDAQIQASVTLEKSETMLIFHQEMRGTVTVPCDRCGTELILPIEETQRQVVKFGNVDEQQEVDDLIVLPDNEFEFDLSPTLYQTVILSLPKKRVHPEDECDQEALETLEKLQNKTDDSSDPRWDALKNLRMN